MQMGLYGGYGMYGVGAWVPIYMIRWWYNDTMIQFVTMILIWLLWSMILIMMAHGSSGSRLCMTSIDKHTWTAQQLNNNNWLDSTDRSFKQMKLWHWLFKKIERGTATQRNCVIVFSWPHLRYPAWEVSHWWSEIELNTSVWQSVGNTVTVTL